MRQVYWQTLYCNYYIRNEAHRREHIDIRWNPYKTCLSFRIQKVIAIISITPRVLRSLLITNRRKSIKENCRSNYPIDESAFVRNKIVGGDETAKLWPVTGEICVASFLFERNEIRSGIQSSMIGLTTLLSRTNDLYMRGYDLFIADTALHGRLHEETIGSQRKTPGFRHRFVCRGARVFAGPGNERFTTLNASCKRGGSPPHLIAKFFADS